jgi:hypothetical protein
MEDGISQMKWTGEFCRRVEELKKKLRVRNPEALTGVSEKLEFTKFFCDDNIHDETPGVQKDERCTTLIAVEEALKANQC